MECDWNGKGDELLSISSRRQTARKSFIDRRIKLKTYQSMSSWQVLRPDPGLMIVFVSAGLEIYLRSLPCQTFSPNETTTFTSSLQTVDDNSIGNFSQIGLNDNYVGRHGNRRTFSIMRSNSALANKVYDERSSS